MPALVAPKLATFPGSLAPKGTVQAYEKGEVPPLGVAVIVAGRALVQTVGELTVTVSLGFTVKTMSSLVKLFVHCPWSCTVNRKVALPGPFVRFTVSGKFVQPLPHELVPMICAGPETTVQVRDVIGLSPDWAVPFRVKALVGPWLQAD